MTYQAVAFFDLDGTLLNEKSQITPEITQAIQQLKNNRVLPIIATGRTESEIHHIKQAAGITSNIVMNGAFIRIEEQAVHSDCFSLEQCQALVSAVNEAGDELAFYNEQGYWGTGHNQAMIDAYDFVHSPLPSIDPLGFETRSVNMALMLGVGNDRFYQERFPELTFYRNTPYSIDIVKNGTSKGSGVKTLIERLNLGQLPTFGFGDGSNDLALLSACDHKIAMGNAKTELKEVATFITKDNTDGGIVHALNHFDLL
ncbi:MAG: Cof-type HAD-IIB family hydrolase [Enterococcus sp.]